MTVQIGSTIGDYEVTGILGAGGMGQVYKVRNTISDRVEAMKVLLPDLSNAPDLADRFLREIQVQASMDHPNIAALHTAVRVDNQLVMLMEFVDGVTLDQKIKEGPLPVPQAVGHIMQVLAALDYAHQRGIVHRDIKPGNMMLTPTGVVKLMDFGIAKASSDHKLTMTGVTVGSIYYMSPEQIQGVVTPDGRSDLYSVGVSLYEVLTGKRPFDGDSQFAIMTAHLEKTPVPPISIDSRLPKALNDVIMMSVARDPSQRFQTAAAFRNALGSVVGLAAAPAPAPAKAAEPQQIVQPAKPEKARGNRGLWIAIGSLMTAAVVIGLIMYGPWKGSKAAPAASITTQTPAAATQSEPAAPAPEQAAPASLPAAVEVPESTEPAIPQKQPSTPSAGAKANRDSQPPPPLQPLPEQPAVQRPAPAESAAPVNPGPSHEEIEAAREQHMMLNTRATGIRTSLRSLQRSQAASGMNLRGDMQEAASLMDNYLAAATSALNAGDTASAKTYMDKAERQIEKLEKFLNR